MLNIVTETLRLDLWDLNYGDTVVRPFLFEKTTVFADSKTGAFKRFGAFLWYFLYSIRSLPKTLSQTFRPGATFVFVVTQNQVSSLTPLLKNLKSSYLIRDRDIVQTDYLFPLFWAYLFSFLCFPLLLYRLFTAPDKKIVAHSFRHGLDRLLLTYGYYIAGRIWLFRNRVGSLVVASDNDMYFRVLTKAARDENIPTIYIQHASVTKWFPSLSFDYALLEGHDSLGVYSHIGSSDTTVYLVGMPKFDRYLDKVNTNRRVNRIGICANMLDSLKRVDALCLYLTENFDAVEVFLRPHPREERMLEWRNLCIQRGINISEPREEEAFSFLTRVDMIIAGNSSIHLEAALLNIYPLMFNFSDDSTYQAYSYVERGLCEHVMDMKSLHARLEVLINSKPDVRHRAKEYCATVDTPYDGHSSQLTSELVNAITAREPIVNDDWRKIDASLFDAYEPTEAEGSFSYG